MTAYLIRRLLLMIPTLLGIMLVSFVVVQFAPGGPVERVIAQLSGSDTGATSRISGSPGGDFGARGQLQGASQLDAVSSKYRGAQGLDPEFIKRLEQQFGFDKPAYERFFLMLKNYLTFDFGKSYFRDVKVIDLIKEKLAVSMWLGIWMTRLTSDNWSQLPWYAKIGDYFWHLTLPIISMMLGSFATMTMLTKNSFLDEIRKQYVLTARAKGCNETQTLYGHIFRNAMLIVIAGFTGAFVGAFFGGSLLIETIFSLDGLGLLSFESVLNRDYAVVFANLYIFALVGLVVNLVADLTYTLVAPRIDFETR